MAVKHSHLFALLALGGLSATASAQSVDRIFRNTFDPPPAAFRTTQLALIDPHLYVAVSFLCSDITSQVNEQITTALTTDGNNDQLYDSSPLTLFRPLDQASLGFTVESAEGDCTLPTMGNPTACDMNRNSIPQSTTYSTLASGQCSGIVPGSASAYTPAIQVPAAPCYQTAPRTLTVNFNGVPVSLIDGSSAGRFNANPATELTTGLQRGFLREADANQIILTLPIVGPRTLSSLLPGGTGSCNNILNGKDTYNGQSGWWFYLNSTASSVPYVGP
jgi:hypothetical protein